MLGSRHRSSDRQSAWLFIDWWNCRNALFRSIERRRQPPWEIDWQILPSWLIREARYLLDLDALDLGGASVFSSYTPGQASSERHRDFCHGILEARYGYEVTLLPRTRRRPPRCPVCSISIPNCPNCGRPLSGRQEKGVDTALAFRMAQVAMRGEADILIIASGDSDFAPIVTSVRDLGRTVIQAAFVPEGENLARTCHAVIDINAGRSSIEYRRRR